jgi:hypothetical protein
MEDMFQSPLLSLYTPPTTTLQLQLLVLLLWKLLI